MTKEQLRMQMLAGIITESQYKAKLNENDINHLVIVSPQFGGYEDKEFLKIVWKLSIQELESLLQDTIKDIGYYKNSNRKGLFGALDRKLVNIAKNRIKYLKQIINKKQTYPDFYPDFLK